MEDQKNHLLSSEGPESYSKELDVAVRAVQMACSLCQKVQDSLVSKTNTNNSPVHSKDDNSPVTVAGNTFSPCSVSFIFWFGFFDK